MLSAAKHPWLTQPYKVTIGLLRRDKQRFFVALLLRMTYREVMIASEGVNFWPCS